MPTLDRLYTYDLLHRPPLSSGRMWPEWRECTGGPPARGEAWQPRRRPTQRLPVRSLGSFGVVARLDFGLAVEAATG
jgi:hypothetical protein